jgi:tetratricopeptide (TPR) repeat protein
MEFEEYRQLTQQAATLVGEGRFGQAIDVLNRLIGSNISDRDKAMMCLNLAFVYDKMDKSPEALTWYDQGIAYERRHCQFHVTESKAAYLANQGRIDESLAIYEELARQPYLLESDKERIRGAIAQLQNR